MKGKGKKETLEAKDRLQMITSNEMGTSVLQLHKQYQNIKKLKKKKY